MNDISTAAQWIKETDNIVFFGGAGTSTKSGVPDFRSEDGLYNTAKDQTIAPEYALSAQYLHEDPDAFSHFYKNHLIYPDAQPTILHEMLVKWEREGKLKAVITQNIDNLHQNAGSEKVIELHGNLSDHVCTKCGREYDLSYAMRFEKAAACEACGGLVRPVVTLYGESLPMGAFEEAARCIAEADVLIVAGTSLVVYPAAGLLQYYRKDKLILINQQQTPMDGMANLLFREDIGQTLAQIDKGAQ